MLDPITAIGLASSIVAFIDFGAKIVKGTIEIYDAADGTLEENRSREAVAAEMKRFAARLAPPDHSLLAGQERSLCKLAEECLKLAEELSGLLERLRPKDVTSKRQSLWAALKNKVNEHEREDLENRLDACRNQLELHVSFETLTSVDVLSAHVKHNTGDLKLLATAVSELLSIGADSQASVRQLLDIQQGALHTAINDRILASLRFKDMYGRCDMVERAHEKTFLWIFNADDAMCSGGQVLFNDDDPGEGQESIIGEEEGRVDEDEYEDEEEKKQLKREQLEMRQEARERFLQWLSSGTGIFHISGKMGSGKSTLMKYLSRHPETKARLDEWANGKQLVLANFFFWRPGSDLQKSLGGLYRSLLHDVLKSRPELMPSVLPGIWNKATEALQITQAKLEIPDDEVRKAFALLISKTELCANHCFCFFIDGLDEYQTTAEHDYVDMVNQLCSWTTALPSNVKLCVSSREYHTFMNAFSSSQRLRLHMLTQHDIELYVKDRLRHGRDSKSRATLASSIVKKASGVFFWVSLVVKDMREQLENGVEPADVLEILNDLPNELDELYRHILGGLSKYSRKRAHQTLAMIPFTTDSEYQVHLDLLAYSFLNDYNANPKFSRRDTFKAKLPVEKLEDCARNYLNGWCRGLVEVNKLGYLAYAHRSVADFVEAADIQTQIAASIDGLHPCTIMSELILAEIKTRVGAGDALVGLPFLDLIRMRQKYGLDQAPYPFLRCLDSVSAGIWDYVDNPLFDDEVWMTSCQVSYTAAIGQLTKDRPFRTRRWLCLSHYFFPDLDSTEYILWMIANEPTTTNTTSKVVLLFYTAMQAPRLYPVLDLLLDRNIISPGTRTHLLPEIPYLICNTVTVEADIDGGHSIWQNFLLKEFYDWLDSLSYDAGKGFCAIAERLLQRGADPRFRFEAQLIQPSAEATAKPEVVNSFYFGDPDRSENFSFRRRWGVFYSDKDSRFDKIPICPREPNGPRREITLRDWIWAMSDFPGKDALLQLLDEKIHEVEMMGMDQSAKAQDATEELAVDTKDAIADKDGKGGRLHGTSTELSSNISVSFKPFTLLCLFAAVLSIFLAMSGFSRPQDWKVRLEQDWSYPSGR